MSELFQLITSRLDSALEWWSTPHHLRGMRLMRACLGWIITYIYAVNFAQRDLLFGPDRLTVMGNGLFGILPGHIGFEIMYALAMASALCFAIGWGGRITTAAVFIFFCSLTNVTPLTGDGGDNLLRLILAYLVLADLYPGRARAGKPSLSGKIFGVLHNFAWLACVTQLCILYWDAGFQKAAGDMWRDGTALYYVLQTNQFSYPPVTNLLLSHPALLVFCDYSTMVFQLAFPFMMLNRWSKYVAIAISMSFHIGIMISMCLISFSAIMMSTELALLSDWDYAKLTELATRAWRLLASLFPVRVKAPAIEVET